MNDHTTRDPSVKLCECGCGTPLPEPQFPSRQRRFIVGHSMKGRKKKRIPLAKRFWSKVAKGGPDECWEWLAYRDKDGYGHIRTDDENFADTPAHRVSYELHYGPIPPGMIVCHTCDNPPCVNPAHLFLGTHQDNVDDMITKGRKRVARGERKSGSKLTAQAVREIRSRYRRGNGRKLAAEYGVTPSVISVVVNHKTWKHVKP